MLRQQLRLGIGTLRSGTYKIWVGKEGSFYIAPRELGGAIKVSMHPDENWFVGFEGGFVRGREPDLLPPNQPRVMK